MSRPSPVVNPALLTDPGDSSSGRRLTIYFQRGLDVPVAPEVNAGVDVADAIKAAYVDYTATQAVAANTAIPIVAGDDRQPVYVSAEPDLNTSGLTSEAVNAALAPATMFNPRRFQLVGVGSGDRVSFGSSKNELGVNDPVKNQKLQNITNYVRNVESRQDSAHSKIVDSEKLESSGYNDANKYLRSSDTTGPAVQVGRTLRLGSVFYNKLGAYVSSSYTGQPILDGSTVKAANLTVTDLENIAINMMFDAVQGDAGLDFKYTGTSSDDIEAEARMAIPSPQRLGKKVPMGRFSAAREIKKLYGIEKRSESNIIDSSDYLESHGSFYNQFSQFDSLIPLGQIAVSVAMVLGFNALLSSIGAIIRAASSNNPEVITSFNELSVDERRSLLGVVSVSKAAFPTSEVGGLDILTQTLGITSLFSPTLHDSDSCLLVGIEEFFGFSFGTGLSGRATPPSQQAARGSLKVLTESGRLNVILREILRSGISIVESAQADFTGGASLAGISNLVRRIKNTKMLKFVDLLMQIGDRIKMEDDLKTDASLNGNPSFNVSASSNVSYVDSLPDQRAFYAAKSRLSDGRMAWGASTATSMLLPVDSLLMSGLSESIGGARMGYPLPSRAQDPGFLTGNQRAAAIRSGRLDAESVAKFERELEQDYMPFYFQDLRTNEMISFHAFMEDVSEDFGVDYSSTDGYGRIDKVQIYKGTTRTVNVAFKMIATNEDDMAAMWYKLNRLAMLIYPQWTGGREVNVGDIKFTQPYSQIPGATPVVRMRLGDLFKSNYSKMAVARLFGISTRPDYNVTSRQPNQPRTVGAQTENTSQPASQGNSGQNTVAFRVAALQDPQVQFTSNQSNSSAEPRTINPTDVFTGPDPRVYLNIRPIASQLRRFRAGPSRRQITANNSSARILARFVDVSATSNKANFQLISLVTPGPNGNQRSEVITGPSGAEPTISLSLSAGFRGMIDVPKTVSEMQRSDTSAQSESQRTSNNTSDGTVGIGALTPEIFYDDDKNPILKSFKSTAGRGLAGVVTSFKVDYSEAKGNWGTDASRLNRAPMFMTVQVGLAVIHDAPLGLDANGMMLAPIWPVGHYANFYAPVSRDLREQSPNYRGSLLSRFDPEVNPYFNRKR